MKQLLCTISLSLFLVFYRHRYFISFLLQFHAFLVVFTWHIIQHKIFIQKVKSYLDLNQDYSLKRWPIFSLSYRNFFSYCYQLLSITVKISSFILTCICILAFCLSDLNISRFLFRHMKGLDILLLAISMLTSIHN